MHLIPNKTYRVYPKAIDDLESIYFYSIKEFGRKKATSYIIAIEKGFQFLVSNPEISRKCDYIRKDLRALNVGSHIIFFKITDYGVAVIRVLHKSMDFERHI